MPLGGSAGPVMDRRKLLAAGSTMLGLAMLPGRAWAHTSFVEGPIVETGYGKLRGLVDGSVIVFRGIPYGASTGGENRFLPAKPPESWTHVRDAFSFGPSAPQTNPDIGVLRNPKGLPVEVDVLEDMSRDPAGVIESEDCLRLNVSTPSIDSSAKKPVMVWIHGGGYWAGSASWDMYQTQELARAHDVVVVGINHRLNAFGFTQLGVAFGQEYEVSGNVGQTDIVAALRWIRENIAAFGGDPGNVTVFGESGGGIKVSMLMAMPSAKGLFHKAIVQSGAITRANTRADADESAAAFLSALDLKPGQLRELQQLPTRSLLRAYFKTMDKLGGLNTSGKYNEHFFPFVDGTVLPRHPFDPDASPEGKEVPLLLGFNRTETTVLYTQSMELGMDEATLRKRVLEMPDVTPKAADRILATYRKLHPQATPWDRYILITTDAGFGLGTIKVAERKLAQKAAPVYLYRFDYETSKLGGHIRAMHGVEIPFVLDNVKGTSWLVDDTPATNALARQVSATWAAFARTGDPNNPGLPHWAPYDTRSRPTMIFNLETRAEHDPEREARLALTPSRTAKE